MKKYVILTFMLFALPLFGNDMDLETTHSSFTIRPVQLNEEEMLYELICELALCEGKSLSTLPLTKENLARYGFSEAPLFQTEVAELDGKLVAYALYYYGFSAHQGRPILYIEDLYVKHDYRSIGIGRNLLKQLAKYATDKGCCRLEWHVFDWNDSAIDFYQMMGGTMHNELILVRLEKEMLQRLATEE